MSADALSSDASGTNDLNNNNNNNPTDTVNNNESYLNNPAQSKIDGGTTESNNTSPNDTNPTDQSSNDTTTNNTDTNNESGAISQHAFNQQSTDLTSAIVSDNDEKTSNNNNNNNPTTNNPSSSGSGGGSKVPSRFSSKRSPSSQVLKQDEEFEQRQIEKMNAVTQAVASSLYESKEETSNGQGNDNNNNNGNNGNNNQDNKPPPTTNDNTVDNNKQVTDPNNTNGNTNGQPQNGQQQPPPPSAPATQVPVSLHPEIDRVISKLMTMTMRRSRKSKYITATQTDPKNMLTEKELENVCQQSRKIFMSQPMLIEIDAPIKIVGDIHGQYFDLLRLFELGGMPPDANYVFLGDYVDRGRNSLEVISLLLSFKIKYPLNFFLLRGNHECASINRIYGFFDECKRRYKSGVQLWKKFCDVFNCLPVAAVIDDKIFCMHGGLSPDLRNFDQIRKIRRPTDVPDSGLLCDLLWADPDKEQIGWGENDRGVSYTFGPDILAKFLRKHDMDLVCRAHQVVEDGYEFFGSRRLVTIFSAPNYCGEFDNAGAMMSVDDTLMCSFHILKPTFGTKGTRFYS